MPLSKEKAKEIGKLGGRPKGVLNKTTIDKIVAKKHFEDRIIRATDMLINSQLSLAKGQTFLFKIEKEFVKTGEKKNGEDIGYWKNLKPVKVENEEEIQMYLEGLVEEGDMQNQDDPSATYYFITTKEPNNMAIDSLHNRVHGKPKETIDVSGEVKFSLRELASRRAKLLETHGKIIDSRVVDGLIEEPKTDDEQVVDEI